MAVHTPGPRYRWPWSSLSHLRRDPLDFLTRMAAHGPVSRVRVLGQPVYVLSDPSAIEDVLVTRASQFMKGRALERAKRTVGEGLLTSEGAFHLRQRRLMQPAFHRSRIAEYAAIMARAACAMRDRWTADVPLDLSAEMHTLTLAIVSDTLFGAPVGSDSDTRRVQQAVTDVMEMFDLVMLPWAELLLRLPLPRIRRFHEAQRILDARIYGLIADRRASGADRGDLLSLLLQARDAEDGHDGMTDRQVRDEVITLFLAGHETTANALIWTWWLLAAHPEVEARLHAELDAVLQGRPPGPDDAARLPFTRAVVAESMRLYPPAWTLGRKALRDYEWGGHLIPAGTLVLMSQWVMHRHPQYWPEAERFHPDRWLDTAADRPRFAYFPFGGGTRLCIGEHFAWTEAILIVAAVAQRWRLRPAAGQTLAPQPLITLRAQPALRVTPVAR